MLRPALGVQVFGQRELVRRIGSGDAVGSHLISVGDARPFLGLAREEERLPASFKAAFRRILRLGFNDRLSSEAGKRGRPPRPSDVRRTLRFVKRTMARLGEFRREALKAKIRANAARPASPELTDTGPAGGALRPS